MDPCVHQAAAFRRFRAKRVVGRLLTAGSVVAPILEGRFERPSSAGFSHSPAYRWDLKKNRTSVNRRLTKCPLLKPKLETLPIASPADL